MMKKIESKHICTLDLQMSVMCYSSVNMLPVSGAVNRYQSSGARNHDTRCQQTVLAEK